MPTKLLESYQEQSGKSMEEVEQAWDKAKKQANRTFPKGEKDPHYWSYVNITTRMMLGIEKKKKEQEAKERKAKRAASKKH